jgi:hypothetical protein
MTKHLFIAIGLLLSCHISVSQTKTEETNSLTFIGVGDMMMGTHFPSKKYLPPNNDPYPLMQEVIPTLHSADVVFGNLEGAFLDKGAVFKRCKDTTKCYAFKTPTSYAPVLKKAGFNLLSLANNHIRDFGPAGMRTTTALLDSMQIPYAGLISKPFDTLRVANKLIGLCAFAPNTGTVQIGDIAGAKKIVMHLSQMCDYVLVSFHGGAEGAKHQHITREDEIFYGENRGNVYAFSHAMIDAGADIVFGHGPHVPRSVEVYRNKFIAYSLGNFFTYSRFNLSGPNGLSPVIKVSVDENGDFVQGQIHSFRQVKGAGVFSDPQHTVAKKIKDLTFIDFPELQNRLFIDEEGSIFMPFERKMSPLGLQKVLNEDSPPPLIPSTLIKI